jgi:hypothetical protein
MIKSHKVTKNFFKNPLDKLKKIVYNISTVKEVIKMMVTQNFKLTNEEREHLTYVMRFFRELDGDMNIREKLSYHFCEEISDRLNWFLEEFDGMNEKYEIGVPFDGGE